MKHLPNLLTLGNLFCGCMAIAYILTAQPYFYRNISSGLPAYEWVYGVQQVTFGCLFIGIAAICDFLDGLTARALKVFSPIGKDLDSLADVVSFGVAPSIIIYKLLWDALMRQQDAFDASMLGMAPAFLIACFAALRLARFNISAGKQKKYFIGMPTPAVGLFVACLPIALWQSSDSYVRIFEFCLLNKWGLYLLIAILCWLMVSKVQFFKLLPSRWTIGAAWPQLTLIVFAAIALPVLRYAAPPFIFAAYILLSLIHRQPDEDTDSSIAANA